MYIDFGQNYYPVYRVGCCSSSMDEAWKLIGDDRFPCWSSLLAETQTSGRGQMDRTWESPLGNLYGTLRLPQLESEWSELVHLFIAESVRSVLADHNLSLAIKWPNDLLIRGKKVGGILVEERSGVLIAGIGINLISAPSDGLLRHPLTPRPGHLNAFGVSISPMDLWIPLVRHIRFMFESIMDKEKPKEFIRSILPHMAYLGDRILLDGYKKGEKPVIFKGIGIRGGIVVQTPEGERIIRSGSLFPLI